MVSLGVVALAIKFNRSKCSVRD